ncbi:MAG: tRNA (5-methylaminomethyl-2-thiouridylate)-methyltransferase [Gammaproteobacteria bacterium]|nr:tRNA (5-methylaminomethyl-2-thiouridylate)-methyltransferase [Gammaproteobacteria bacterium]
MNPENIKQPKAVALISGGLDSMLAARVIMEQGVHVEGINFYTGFCVEGHTQAIRNQDKNKPKRNNALWAAEQLGIKLHIIDIVEEYKDVLLKPKHGYGQHMNPCLDCKIFMVRKAKQWADENGFDFIITGEVIGQRPMSQRKATMPIIAKESDVGSRLVRPLCAKFLPETYPEKMGWIDRNKMHDISGRSRKPQMALAEKFAIDEYAQPAGGCCMLTNEHYSKKLVDLWQAKAANNQTRDYTLDDIIMLKIGRHFRPKENFKVIISRDEGESNFLRGYRSEFTWLELTSHDGPLTIVDGHPTEEDLLLAARMTARYSQGRDADTVEVQLTTLDGVSKILNVEPLPADEVLPQWHI